MGTYLHIYPAELGIYDYMYLLKTGVDKKVEFEYLSKDEILQIN